MAAAEVKVAVATVAAATVLTSVVATTATARALTAATAAKATAVPAIFNMTRTSAMAKRTTAAAMAKTTMTATSKVAGIDIQAAAAAVGCDSNGENNQLKATAVTHLKKQTIHQAVDMVTMIHYRAFFCSTANNCLLAAICCKIRCKIHRNSPQFATT